MAQKDSKVNIALAESSALIARETRRDSEAMKTIAVLTMFFLPGTFLAVCVHPFLLWQHISSSAHPGCECTLITIVGTVRDAVV